MGCTLQLVQRAWCTYLLQIMVGPKQEQCGVLDDYSSQALLRTLQGRSIRTLELATATKLPNLGRGRKGCAPVKKEPPQNLGTWK